MEVTVNSSPILSANLMNEYQESHMWGKIAIERFKYTKSMILNQDFLQMLNSIRLAIVTSIQQLESSANIYTGSFKVPNIYLMHTINTSCQR